MNANVLNNRTKLKLNSEKYATSAQAAQLCVCNVDCVGL